MTNRDYAPSRFEVVVHAASYFISHYFQENPLSQLQLIVTSDALAKALTPLSGNPAQHLRALTKEGAIPCEGDISIKNALDLSVQSLRNIARYGTREVLFIISALSTCDPGPLGPSIEALQQYGINVSLVGLSAEMHICKKISQATKGTYGVSQSEAHFLELLKAALQPPAATENDESESGAIEIGFPKFSRTLGESYCSCHQKLTREGFHCPVCHSKQCHIPTHCCVCGLTLASSADLSISYRHLFPTEVFVSTETTGDWTCQSCLSEFTKKEDPSAQVCPACSSKFCKLCDDLIHFESHTCPGCI